MAQTSKNSGMSAKEYAQQQLGNLDLSYLDKERQTAQNIYNTSKSSLENSFNNLISQINSNRSDARKNFNTGRATVAENAYDANRVNQADVASRVVGSTGLKTLGEIGNRMETGKQYSNLANEFYDTMTDLDTSEKQGRQQYDTDLQSIKNTLDSTLSDIGSREAEAKNNYNLTLGQLAEAIQGRWDSNANAEASLAQARAAAAQAHNDAVNSAKQQLSEAKRQALNNIVNSGASVDKMVAQIQATFGVDANMANNVLKELGLTPTTSFDFSANETYTPSNYVGQLVGGW